MTWNYRIIKYKNDQGYGLHEVYYGKDGGIGWTKNAVSFHSDIDEGPEGIKISLAMALLDALKRPIIDEANPKGNEMNRKEYFAQPLVERLKQVQSALNADGDHKTPAKDGFADPEIFHDESGTIYASDVITDAIVTLSSLNQIEDKND